jgi:DNA modification methylase
LSIINKTRFSQNLEYIVRIYYYGTALNRLDENDFYNRVKKTSPVLGTDKIHLTQKPVSLMQQFVELSSKEGDIVLDPYMGSGTTAIACHRTHRHFIGFEINSEFFQKAERRIKAEQAQMSLFD